MVNIGAFTLAPSVLIVNGMQDIEEWEKSARAVFAMQRSVYWWIGDMVTFGEARFGDDFYQAVPEGVSLDLLTRCATVSREFPPGERNMNVSWSHHQALVGWAPELKRTLLAKAESSNMSNADFREYLSRIKGNR